MPRGVARIPDPKASLGREKGDPAGWPAIRTSPRKAASPDLLSSDHRMASDSHREPSALLSRILSPDHHVLASQILGKSAFPARVITALVTAMGMSWLPCDVDRASYMSTIVQWLAARPHSSRLPTTKLEIHGLCRALFMERQKLRHPRALACPSRCQACSLARVFTAAQSHRGPHRSCTSMLGTIDFRRARASGWICHGREGLWRCSQCQGQGRCNGFPREQRIKHLGTPVVKMARLHWVASYILDSFLSSLAR